MFTKATIDWNDEGKISFVVPNVTGKFMKICIDSDCNVEIIPAYTDASATHKLMCSHAPELTTKPLAEKVVAIFVGGNTKAYSKLEMAALMRIFFECVGDILPRSTYGELKHNKNFIADWDKDICTISSAYKHFMKLFK